MAAASSGRRHSARGSDRGRGAPGRPVARAPDQPGAVVHSSVPDVPNGVWKHLAATYDPTGHVLEIYLNAVEVGSASSFTLGGANSAPLRIAAAGTCSQYFPGEIDDVRIYRRTLSA